MLIHKGPSTGTLRIVRPRHTIRTASFGFIDTKASHTLNRKQIKVLLEWLKLLLLDFVTNMSII